MSPLWSEAALAEAGWADAVARGRVDEAPCPWPRRGRSLERVRRIPRPLVDSLAL